jgi:hypothetical protein
MALPSTKLEPAGALRPSVDDDGLYLSRNIHRDFQGPALRKHAGVGL